MKTKPVITDNIEPASWDEFRHSGLLFYINTILHFIGWVICIKLDDSGRVISAYPARTKFRGFSEEDIEAQHKKFANHLASIAPNFPEEIKD